MIKKEWLAKACLFSCCSGIVGTQNVGAAFNLQKVNPINWFYFLREYITRYLFPDYYTSNLAEEAEKVFEKYFKGLYSSFFAGPLPNGCFVMHSDITSLKLGFKCDLGIDRNYLEIAPHIKVFLKNDKNKLIREFYIDSEGKLEEFKNRLEFFTEKSQQNIDRMDQLPKEFDFYVDVDENSYVIFVVTWADNFKPKFTFENKEIVNKGELSISKLEYNSSTKSFFAYSPDFEGGTLSIPVKEEEVEELFKSIKKQKEEFDFNLINNVKQQISEKYKNIEWKYNDKNRRYEGVFEIGGMKFTINLQSRKSERDGKYRCEIEMFGECFLYCDSLEGKEGEKFDEIMESLRFCMEELKKLKETGEFEYSENINGGELISKKPFSINYEDGFVADQYDTILFWKPYGFGNTVEFNDSGSCFSELSFDLDKEEDRKEFCNFVNLWANKKVENHEISYYDYCLPQKKYTKFFDKLSPCNQENCRIQFRNGEFS